LAPDTVSGVAAGAAFAFAAGLAFVATALFEAVCEHAANTAIAPITKKIFNSRIKKHSFT
jgi:hypothetical protein